MPNIEEEPVDFRTWVGLSKLCAVLLSVVKYAREAPPTALGNSPRKDSHL